MPKCSGLKQGINFHSFMGCLGASCLRFLTKLSEGPSGWADGVLTWSEVDAGCWLRGELALCLEHLPIV